MTNIRSLLMASFVSLLLSACGDDIDKKGLKFATKALASEILDVVDGTTTGLLSKQEAMSLIGINATTTAKRYYKSYEINEVAANEEFKNKRVLLTGVVYGIETSIGGDPVLVLDGDGMTAGARAQFPDSYTKSIATVRKGDKVEIVCKGRGKLMIALLDDCRFANAWALENKTKVEAFVKGVINGSSSTNNEASFALTFLYIVGKHIPDDSVCFTGNALSEKWMKSCEPDMKKAAQSISGADKEKLESIIGQSQK